MANLAIGGLVLAAAVIGVGAYKTGCLSSRQVVPAPAEAAPEVAHAAGDALRAVGAAIARDPANAEARPVNRADTQQAQREVSRVIQRTFNELNREDALTGRYTQEERINLIATIVRDAARDAAETANRSPGVSLDPSVQAACAEIYARARLGGSTSEAALRAAGDRQFTMAVQAVEEAGTSTIERMINGLSEAERQALSHPNTESRRTIETAVARSVDEAYDQQKLRLPQHLRAAFDLPKAQTYAQSYARARFQGKTETEATRSAETARDDARVMPREVARQRAYNAAIAAGRTHEAATAAGITVSTAWEANHSRFVMGPDGQFVKQGEINANDGSYYLLKTNSEGVRELVYHDPVGESRKSYQLQSRVMQLLSCAAVGLAISTFVVGGAVLWPVTLAVITLIGIWTLGHLVKSIFFKAHASDISITEHLYEFIHVVGTPVKVIAAVIVGGLGAIPALLGLGTMVLGKLCIDSLQKNRITETRPAPAAAPEPDALPA